VCSCRSVGLRARLGSRLIFGLSAGLIVGLGYWLLLGLFNGLSSNILDEHRRLVPNQGMRRSARNGVLIGIISVFLSWLFCILIYGLYSGLSALLSNGQPLEVQFEPSVLLSIGLRIGPRVGLVVVLPECGLA